MLQNKKLRKIILRIPFSVKIYFTLISLINIPGYLADLFKFKKSNDGRFSLRLADLYPRLADKAKMTPFDPHYINHPAWAARVVVKIKPEYHVDIASSLHFSTIVSAFVPVRFYDFRPAQLNLSGLTSEHIDLTNIRFEDNSIKSLSCMHTIEHIGLGRYGDPIDPMGDIKAMKELKRVLAPGGSLLFVVPMGRPRIEFNAHRIYSYRQVMENFSDLTLKEFSLVPDNYKEAGFIYNADPEIVAKQEHGCGCFWFVKK